ncbi:MAG TPA: prolyl oligopeptidase family serine peptidase [Aliidongia sp.]|nr:prolyl oligopeptidase family serine peptidase [Aliidongia sp.]
MNRYWTLTIASLGLLAADFAAAATSPVERREAGQLVLENIPPTPPALAESLRAYENVRFAAFDDWLADGSMLISTRFAQTAQIHHVAFPGAAREQVTFYDEPIAGAVARPGSANAFLFRRDVGGAEYFQTYLTALTGGTVPITEPGTRNDRPIFSRDGTQIAWTAVEKGKSDYDIWITAAAEPASRRRVFHGEGAVEAMAFSPDGKTLVFSHEISAASQKLFLLDIASGTAHEINPSATEIAYGRPQFTPDGKSLILTSDEGAEFQRLVRYDLASGKMSPIGEPLAWDVELTDLSPDGQLLAFAVNEDGFSKIYIRSLAGGPAEPVPGLPIGVAEALRFSPDSKRLAIGLDSATALADVWSFEPASGKLDRWTRSETGGLDPAGFVEPSLVHFPSFDERTIPAFVYKPKAHKGRLPVIISIHGGPEAQERPGFRPVYQYWVKELGAAVITPNVRGSDGYGKTYLSLDNGFKRQDSVKDIGALLDWIGRQPDLDPNRVVVSGGSYGGFMTLASFALYGDRLAGAYDIVGMSNLVTFLEHTEEYRRDLRRMEYGDERVPEMRKFMEETAPLNNTAKMTKPLFVVAGKNDPRVPYTEAEQLIAKVRAESGDVWYMLANDEGHGFRKKPNRDAQRAAETLWFQKVLGVGP